MIVKPRTREGLERSATRGTRTTKLWRAVATTLDDSSPEPPALVDGWAVPKWFDATETWQQVSNARPNPTFQVRARIDSSTGVPRVTTLEVVSVESEDCAPEVTAQLLRAIASDLTSRLRRQVAQAATDGLDEFVGDEDSPDLGRLSADGLASMSAAIEGSVRRVRKRHTWTPELLQKVAESYRIGMMPPDASVPENERWKGPRHKVALDFNVSPPTASQMILKAREDPRNILGEAPAKGRKGEVSK
jgi:hypothetical protein